MSDVLDQSEIDALLNAVDDGAVDEPGSDIAIFSRHRTEFDDVEIRPYDFARPERISKDQMRAVQTLHDTFARNFGASLSGFLRSIVEVRVVNAEQMTYAEFVSSLPNPTSFNLLNAESLQGQMCLEISPLIIYPIIDRLLGGSSHDLFIPQRPATMIEGRLVRQILDRAMTALSEAWEGVEHIDFTFGETESNPQLVQIVAPNEVVIMIGFEIRMGNRAGTMSLCIPFNVIEPLMDKINAQSWFTSRAGSNTGWEDAIAHQLHDAGLKMAGVLAQTSITVGELRGLEVGDILTTEKPATAPVSLWIEGHPKFIAQVGQHRGARSLKIVRPMQESDRV